MRIVFVFLSVSPQVALHACGVATDMVMEHCIEAGAAFVISPCCYGFIQNAIKFTFPKRFAPAHLGPMSPLRGSAFLNVVSDLVFLFRHQRALVLLFSYILSLHFLNQDFFFSPRFFFGALALALIVTCSHAYVHTICISCQCFFLFFLFTAGLLSSPQCHITFTTGSAPPLFSLSPVLSATGSRVLYVKAVLDIKESQENPVGGNVAVVRIIICSVTEK